VQVPSSLTWTGIGIAEQTGGIRPRTTEAMMAKAGTSKSTEGIASTLMTGTESTDAAGIAATEIETEKAMGEGTGDWYSMQQ